MGLEVFKFLQICKNRTLKYIVILQFPELQAETGNKMKKINFYRKSYFQLRQFLIIHLKIAVQQEDIQVSSFSFD